MSERRKRINRAIEALAGLYEYGSLLASTTPDELLMQAVEEIVRFRALVAANDSPTTPETAEREEARQHAEEDVRFARGPEDLRVKAIRLAVEVAGGKWLEPIRNGAHYNWNDGRGRWLQLQPDGRLTGSEDSGTCMFDGPLSAWAWLTGWTLCAGCQSRLINPEDMKEGEMVTRDGLRCARCVPGLPVSGDPRSGAWTVGRLRALLEQHPDTKPVMVQQRGFRRGPIEAVGANHEVVLLHLVDSKDA